MGVIERKTIEEAKAEILAALGGVANEKTVGEVKSIVEGLETSLGGSLTANVIKKVQRGVTKSNSNYTDVAIQDVDMDKTFININGSTYDNKRAENINGEPPAATLISSNTLRLFGYSSSSVYYTNWEVIEFY